MARGGCRQEARSIVADFTLRTVAAAHSTESRALRIIARAVALESRELRHLANAQLEAGSQRFLSPHFLSHDTAHPPKSGVAGCGVGTASTAPDAAFAQAGRAGHGHDPRSHAGALPRTLRHDARRSAVGGAGRGRPRRDNLSLEPAASSPSLTARVCRGIDAEEWSTDQLYRSHRPLRVDGGWLQHVLHVPRRRSGMDLCASAALPVSPYGCDVRLGLSVSTGP